MSWLKSGNGKSEAVMFEADAALVRELRLVAHTRRQSPEALLAQLVTDGLTRQAARESEGEVPEFAARVIAGVKALR